MEQTSFIRPATKADSPTITKHLLLAMEDIMYAFIGVNSYNTAYEFLYELVQIPENQYSYTNCFVLEQNHEVLATSLIYDGGKLHTLRKPVQELIERKFQRPFQPEDETQAGEFYLDCIAVDTHQQGKGLGKILLRIIAVRYKIHLPQLKPLNERKSEN